MGNKLINVATTENHPPLATALRKFGRAWHNVADIDQAEVRILAFYVFPADTNLDSTVYQ